MIECHTCLRRSFHGFRNCSEYICTHTLSADSRQLVFYLQPDQERSFANAAPIASHSVLTNVASVALLAAACRHIVRAPFVKEIRRKSSRWINAAKPISADIIRSARQLACDGSETVFQRREQLEESCVFFGAPSFTLDRRIKGINPPVSAKFFRTRIIQLSRLRLQHERFAHSP